MKRLTAAEYLLNLHTAAPSLLKACKAIVEHPFNNDDDCLFCNRVEGKPHFKYCIIHHAEAAIDKAEGSD